MATGGREDKGQRVTVDVNVKVQGAGQELQQYDSPTSSGGGKYSALKFDFEEKLTQQGSKGHQKKKQTLRGGDLVRELPYGVLQTLEKYLRPDKVANRQNWRNLGADHDVTADDLDYLDTLNLPVIQMLRSNPHFADYKLTELLDDLRGMDRGDLLGSLKKEHNIE